MIKPKEMNEPHNRRRLGCSCLPEFPCLPHKIDCEIRKETQFSSVTQFCPTLCNPMDCSTTGLPVHQQLPEFTQTHVHQVGDAIQPFHPLSSPSPPAFNLSQHQSLSNESVLHSRWSKYCSFSFSINSSKEYSGLTFVCCCC